MNAPLSPELLALLRCPLTSQPLRFASAEELARIPGECDAALVREDGRAAFPVRAGMPHLTPDAIIELAEPLPGKG